MYILAIEDIIDSIATQYAKSFLTQNRGALTTATTNRPECVDDTVLDRPSRFGVRCKFAFPSEPSGRQFTIKWIKEARSSVSEVENPFVRSDDKAIAGNIAKRTEGQSFAFLKEL